MPPGMARLTQQVAPRAGAWIETFLAALAPGLRFLAAVAPRAGAWIETTPRTIFGAERRQLVAPRAGAWIETAMQARCPSLRPASRPPCGGVD